MRLYCQRYAKVRPASSSRVENTSIGTSENTINSLPEHLMYYERLQHLSRSMEQHQLDAIALNAGPSLTYLTGLHFHLMERPVVLLAAPGKEPVLILPELEQKKLEQASYLLHSYTYPENPASWGAVFRQGLAKLRLEGKKIGIEPGQLRLLEFNHLSSADGNNTFTDASAVIASLRAVKDTSEIGAMKQAVTIAQEALNRTLSLVRIGMSEKELANELVVQLLRQGSEPALPFSPIVSAGPNGANPHAKPSERKLAAGDLLIIDWGATYDAYVSDLTRTFGIGDVDQEYQDIHTIVQQANKAGREAGKPGVSCKTIDNAARAVIESAGYGERFTHRTGHGIGMECHEDPYIRGDNEQILKEGMTYTVEPGIYLEGRNGVRIEDDVVITSTGAESLSDFPRELTIIG